MRILILSLVLMFMGCTSDAERTGVLEQREDSLATNEDLARRVLESGPAPGSTVTTEIPPWDDPEMACVFGDNGDFACCNHGCCWGVVGDQHIHTCGEGMVAAAEDAASAPQQTQPPWDDPQLSCTFWDGGDFVCCLNQGCCWFVDGNTYGWSCPQ